MDSQDLGSLDPVLGTANELPPEEREDNDIHRLKQVAGRKWWPW